MRLGFTVVQITRIQTDLTNVISVEQPTYESFQTQTVTSMRTSTIFSLVRVPKVRLWRYAFLLVAVEQQIIKIRYIKPIGYWCTV